MSNKTIVSASLFGVAAALLLAVPGTRLCAMGGGESELLAEGRYTGIRSIEVESDSFDVNIVGTAASTTTAEVVGSSSVRASVRRRGGTLYVEAKDRRALFSRSGASGRIDIQTFEGVDLEVEVGSGAVDLRGFQGADLDIESGSGNLAGRALFGELSLRTGSGAVELERVGGTLSVRVGSGDLSVLDGEGRIDLETGSGTLTLESVRGIVEGTTGSGAIEVNDGQGSFHLASGSGTIEVTGVGLLQESSFRTGSGDILLEIAGDLEGYSYDLESSSGSITLGDISAGRRLERAGSGPRIVAESGSGSITVGGGSSSPMP